MTETDILNNALILIGDQPVSVADDQTKSGRRFLQVYPMTRDALLRGFMWNFALTRASIASSTYTPAWGYDFAYDLPSDCLQVIQVNQWFYNMASDYYYTSDLTPWKLEGKRILTNFAAPLNIRYTRAVTDTSEFDNNFCELLSIKLAIKLVENLKNNSGIMQTLQMMYKEAKITALKSNAIEHYATNSIDGDFITSRL